MIYDRFCCDCGKDIYRNGDGYFSCDICGCCMIDDNDNFVVSYNKVALSSEGWLSFFVDEKQNFLKNFTTVVNPSHALAKIKYFIKHQLNFYNTSNKTFEVDEIMEHCIICKHGTKIVWDNSVTINQHNGLKYLYCCGISVELRFLVESSLDRNKDLIFSLNKIDCSIKDFIYYKNVESKRFVQLADYIFTGNREDPQEIFDFLFRIYENLIFE